jgi:hypothetical protein
MPFIDALSDMENVGENQKAWCDLIFDIAGQEHIASGNGADRIAWVIGRAVADLEGHTIGFGFRIPLDRWIAGRPQTERKLTFYWSQIWLDSIGPETDRLVQCYADRFDLRTISSPAASITRCAAVALHNGKPPLLTEKCSFKLFFETDDKAVDAGPENAEPESYAELYFNFDLQQKRAWLREKDPAYRLPLMRFLTGALCSEPSVALRLH